MVSRVLRKVKVLQMLHVSGSGYFGRSDNAVPIHLFASTSPSSNIVFPLGKTLSNSLGVREVWYHGGLVSIVVLTDDPPEYNTFFNTGSSHPVLCNPLH
jgi:hypothetical protein